MENKATEERLRPLMAGVLVFMMITLIVVPASAGVTAGENENPVISAIMNIISLIFDPEPDKPLPENRTIDTPEPTPVPVTTQSKPEYKTYDLPIISDPAGARIYLDNISLEKKTPCTTLSVEGEEHTVRLELEGYDSYETTVRADSGGVDADLTSAEKKETSQTGSIYVTSRPDGAMIYVDNKKTTSVTPKVLSGLKPGRHTIKVKIEGVDFVAGSKKVWIEKDAVSSIFFDADLNCPDWTVSIKSDDYSGCQFTADGRLPVHKIPASAEISPLTPFISIRKDGNYISHRISPGTDKDEAMIREHEKTFGKIQIESRPAGAAVFVDGFRTDYTTPCTLTNISEGQHLIRLSKMGCLPEEEEITLTPRALCEIDESLSFSLEPYAYGSLEVTSEPEGGLIYIHDRSTGLKTPHTFQCLAIGTYNVRVTLDKESKTEYDLLVAPDRCTTCDFVLN